MLLWKAFGEARLKQMLVIGIVVLAIGLFLVIPESRVYIAVGVGVFIILAVLLVWRPRAK